MFLIFLFQKASIAQLICRGVALPPAAPTHRGVDTNDVHLTAVLFLFFLLMEDKCRLYVDLQIYHAKNITEQFRM